MGNSGSKNKKKNKGKGGKGSGGDDGCIGNRRVRTIILSIIIGLFFVLATPYTQGSEEIARDFTEGLVGGFCGDTCEDAANAWAFIFAGCVICIVGCIAAVLLFLIPKCADTLGRVAGLILIVGGVVYLIGWIWWISQIPDPTLSTEEADRQAAANKAALFGEALLAGGSAILLGLDALLQIYENEAYRLASNLGIILAVSALCVNAYYLQICEDDTLCIQRDGVEAIATGYLILFWTCLVYIILYICTCCTCDCKDRCIVRVILAVLLIIGGVLCAIGYYVYSGFDEDTDIDNIGGKIIVYYVGYTILIGGLCVVWALDIALDDVKNR